MSLAPGECMRNSTTVRHGVVFHQFSCCYKSSHKLHLPSRASWGSISQVPDDKAKRFKASGWRQGAAEVGGYRFYLLPFPSILPFNICTAFFLASLVPFSLKALHGVTFEPREHVVQHELPNIRLGRPRHISLPNVCLNVNTGGSSVVRVQSCSLENTISRPDSQPQRRGDKLSSRD